MPATTNEVALNIVLADALRSKNPRWKNYIGAEQGNTIFGAAGKRPDIVINPPGMSPVIIETEFSPAVTVEHDAASRIGTTLKDTGTRIENVIALRIPEVLRTTVQAELRSVIEVVEFDSFLVRADPVGTVRWPKSGWLKHQISDVARSIEMVALSERVIAEGMDGFREGVEACTQKLQESAAEGFADPIKKIADVLHQEPGNQTTRMGMAILANAFNFHNAIAGSHEIKPPDQLLDKESLLEEWKRILREVNYWPVFSIATEILRPLRLDTAIFVMKQLRGTSAKLANIGTTSMHDLSGRMLQQLITDRKFLATFYTLPTSAALLSELSVLRMENDWNDLDSYANLRIADLACGTGTLISAAYQSVLSRYRSSGCDDSAIHRPMMENAVIAADIMPVATHLAASQLSSAHPTITFGKCQVYTMPYGKVLDESGGDSIAIGSLDLLDAGLTPTLFATGEHQLSGSQESANLHNMHIKDGTLDLVIMNPPFTRPTNHEITDVPIPSFAGFETSKQEQKRMGAKLDEYLKRIKRKRLPDGRNQVPASNGNAGLASNFFDLAHSKIRDNGVLGLVLPFSFVSGRSWQNARKLLADNYHDITIISIASAGSLDRAFSADTAMAEILVVATSGIDAVNNEEVLYVNLEQRPKSLLAATETAALIEGISEKGQEPKFDRIEIGAERIGTYVRAPLAEGGCAGLRESGISSTMISLKGGG